MTYDGKEVSSRSIIQQIQSLRKKVSEDNYARLLMLYLACYDVAPADRQTLISGITDHDYQDALDNLMKI